MSGYFAAAAPPSVPEPLVRCKQHGRRSRRDPTSDAPVESLEHEPIEVIGAKPTCAVPDADHRECSVPDLPTDRPD
jgi:hypothetical protein